VLANTGYSAQVIRGMKFMVQLLQTFGYSFRFSLCHFHQPEFSKYLILKSGKEIFIYRSDRTGELIQDCCILAGKVAQMTLHCISFTMLSCFRQ